MLMKNITNHAILLFIASIILIANGCGSPHQRPITSTNVIRSTLVCIEEPPIGSSSDGPFLCLDVSQKTKFIIAGGQSGSILLFRVPASEKICDVSCIRRDISGLSQIRTINFSADGGRFIAAGLATVRNENGTFQKGATKAWDRSGEIAAWNFVSQSHLSMEAVFLPNGQSAITFVQAEKTLTIQDYPDGHNIRRWNTQEQITHLAINSNGKIVATAEADSIVRLYDVKTGQVLRAFTGHGDHPITAITFLGDNTLISASNDGVVQFWDIALNKRSRGLVLGKGRVFALDVSTDHTKLIVGTSIFQSPIESNGSQRPFSKFTIFDLENLTPIGSSQNIGEMMWSLRFAPDSKEVFAAGNVIHRWIVK